VSDLWKDHKPELTEEEDRLLWQRVRAIPAPPPEPWWKRLFAMPAVRYGAPAFAVILAAVVYVVERAPEPTLRAPKAVSSRVETTAPSEPIVVHRVMPPRVVTFKEVRLRSAAGSPTDEAAPKGNPAASAKVEEAPKELDAVAKDERQQAERRDASNFAQPASPPSLQKAKAAEPAPAPAPAPAQDRVARKQETTAQSAPAPTQAPTWGAKKSQYLGVDQPPATGLSGLLAGDALPSRGTLASHPVVVETAGPGALKGSVPLPDEPGSRAVIALSPDAAPVAHVESATLGMLRDVKRDGQYERYEDAPARLQAVALAAAFEKALASPKTTPRAKVEKLLVRARAVAARDDATPGAARLVTMIEGALRVWP
jgi:hypothetical protein